MNVIRGNLSNKNYTVYQSSKVYDVIRSYTSLETYRRFY